MSWHYSKRLVDEYLHYLQKSVHEETKRASSLLCCMPSEKQCEKEERSKDWETTKRVQIKRQYF
jgi:hypothetical protein